MRMRDAKALRGQMEATFAKAAPVMTNDEVIENRGLCQPWTPGNHSVGEVYITIDTQIWQCMQDYDNAVYPDIVPGNAPWGTFHKPYHGTIEETAMPWVQPTGAHDRYLTGEYMIWTDGLTYRCMGDTVYTPEEYAAAWEVQG